MVKVGLSPSEKISFYLIQQNPLKNEEQGFLFHLKGYFRSQDV